VITFFRLTNEPDGLGLSCNPEGLSLAGVPLLRKTETGFEPRSSHQIEALLEVAYGRDSTRLQSSLAVIAEALNRGDLARAAITAVLTRTPELDRSAAARLTKVHKVFAKYYDPEEPRDWHGRWTTVGAAHAAASVAAEDAEPNNEDGVSHFSDADRHYEHDAVASNDSDEDGGVSHASTAREEAFEKKYDDLGPTDFAKEVIQFGDRLGRQGQNLSPAEREEAIAEYTFLQDRLSFWLGYDYKPEITQSYLHSAALTLFQGAILSGIARAGHLPPSMLDVAGAVSNYDSAAPSSRPSLRSRGLEPTLSPHVPNVPKELEGLGFIIRNSDANIDWKKGRAWQGIPFEDYHEEIAPYLRRLQPGSTTFDFMNDANGEAISDKTLNTLSVTYIKSPWKIYSRLEEYIDAAADYNKRRVGTDVDPEAIRSRTIQLAVPEYTSPRQWHYLFRAVIYAKSRGVRMYITRIRE
jgi:hypothetical protein